ncbi:hypothetical protein Nepgr_018637 [Nepenthes gracilis]|uniref:Uncharacterized protein n=1 Tax=Nepenthes gracilis TaxID=150966 RepID=A0AAD3STZ4_NEPGR|nr:hypothetical protein Nepgr_018637 [Nepenthes gracilis]
MGRFNVKTYNRFFSLKLSEKRRERSSVITSSKVRPPKRIQLARGTQHYCDDYGANENDQCPVRREKGSRTWLMGILRTVRAFWSFHPYQNWIT